MKESRIPSIEGKPVLGKLCGSSLQNSWASRARTLSLLQKMSSSLISESQSLLVLLPPGVLALLRGALGFFLNLRRLILTPVPGGG